MAEPILPVRWRRAATIALIAASWTATGATTLAGSADAPGAKRRCSGDDVVVRGTVKLRACARIEYESLKLGPGSRLEISGKARIELDDDLSVAKGARISAERGLTIVVSGHARVAGSIRSSGPLSIRDVRQRGGRSRLRITGSLETVRRARASQDKKKEEAVPGFPVSLSGDDLFVLGEISASDGGLGPNAEGCRNVKAKQGGKGGNVSISARGRLTLSAATIRGGSGGRGGIATGDNCPDGGLVTGGNGGRPGELTITCKGCPLEVGIDSKISGFNGGRGGEAIISGQEADHDPARPIAAAGGEGAKSSPALDLPRLKFDSGATLTLEGFSGGKGGNATAKGGKGIDDAGSCNPDTLTPTRAGAQGGKAAAVAGKGGDAEASFTQPDEMKIDDALKGGDGGDAMANGGVGGKGINCEREGAKGGRGGDSDARRGEGGTVKLSGLPAQKRKGKPGTPSGKGGVGGRGGDAAPAPAQSKGGDGGDGGCPGGDGGAGGGGGTPGSRGANC